jgi:hypothetical protein
MYLIIIKIVIIERYIYINVFYNQNFIYYCIICFFVQKKSSRVKKFLIMLKKIKFINYQFLQYNSRV